MKCVSSCFPCLCGSKNSARVTPSEPMQIVQANAGKHHYRLRLSSENAQGVDAQDGGGDAGGGRVNPNFSFGDDEHVSVDLEEDGDSSVDSEESPVRALFIEVGKDRLLRVIHVRCMEDRVSPAASSKPASSVKKISPFSVKSSCEDEEEENEDANSVSTTEETQPDNPAQVQGSVEDDEEEYWFSKWARKPRFRSIFAKNPANRPKISENNNNCTSNSPEENNKLSAEFEMARAAAAAKRRAWAYSNNGICEPITQQPTVNPSDEEEEFNSIAIVNTTKQQWSKSSPEKELSPAKSEGSSSSSNSIQVEVAVEKRSPGGGIFNPAFQDDDDDKEDGDETLQISESDKTEECGGNEEVDTKKCTSSSSVSTASLKSRLSSIASYEEVDAITSEPPEKNTPSPPKTPVLNTNPPDEIAPTTKKPLLFFIHSISSSSDVWHHQMEFFQQLGYQIVAPDILGHGLSSTPLNPKYYYFESLVQDLILIFDHFIKEDMKVVLVGHGYGACLAAMLTRVRLKNVALLITIAGGGPTPLVRRTCCQDSWFSWKCKLFHSNRIRGRFDNPELRHVLPPSIHESVLSGQVWADGDSAFYRRVTVPTLLVYGMRDKVVTLVEECEMERTIPKSFLELIDTAGHMVMTDEPQKLNKMLCKFIQSWS